MKNTLAMENFESRARARKRVDQIKGFYKHLTAYLIVNGFIIAYFITEKIADGEPALTLDTFELALFWGIGLGVHAFSVFGLRLLTGRRWEERQIRKYMEEEEREARKFK